MDREINRELDPHNALPAAAPTAHGEGGEPEDEFHLLPPEGKSREEVEAEWNENRDRRLPLPDDARAELERILAKRKRGKFSLLEVLALITFVSIGLSLSTYLPVHVFAGLLGLLILLALYGLSRFMEESRLARLAWWTMAIFYIAAAVTAVLRG